MLTPNSHVSLLRHIKESLGTYLEIETGIAFNAIDLPDTVLTGYVNIYQIEPIDNGRAVKIHRPFARNAENKLEIELRLTVRSSDYNELDNRLLDQMEFLSGIIENKLSQDGIVIDHPKWKTPTGLKGSSVKTVKKEVRQVTEGNQIDQNDQIFEGSVSLLMTTED